MNAAYLHALYFENISHLKSIITMDSLPFMKLKETLENLMIGRKNS